MSRWKTTSFNGALQPAAITLHRKLMANLSVNTYLARKAREAGYLKR